MNKNKSFCVLPWIHLATHPHGGVSLCCRVDYTNSEGMAFDRRAKGKKILNLNTEPLSEVINSESFREARLQMLQGRWPKACLGCHKDESAGLKSKRLHENEYFDFDIHKAQAVTDSSGRVSAQFQYLELRLGNLCNLKCRTCSPYSSSKWTQEYRILENTLDFVKPYRKALVSSWTEDEKIWKDIFESSKQLKLLFINGGEPTLIKQHWSYLERLIEEGLAGNIDIKYNINMTILPAKAKDIWKKFKSVTIGASIDDLNERNSYIRHGSNWNLIEENLLKIKSWGIPITIEQTVSVMNVYYLDEVERYAEKIGVGYGLNFVYDPNYLAIDVLPKKLKDHVLKKLKKANYSERWLQHVEAHFKTQAAPQLWPRFLAYTKKLDQLRKESFEKTFFEFHHWIEFYQLVDDTKLLLGKVTDFTRGTVMKLRKLFQKERQSFCMVPWTHTFISPQSERRLCCASREKSSFVNQYIDSEKATSNQYNPITLGEHWNGDFLKSVRKKMLAGEKVPECEVCNNKVLNLYVYRDWFTKQLFPHKMQEVLDSTSEDGSTTMRPVSFDYRVHNTCNFKCRMCGEQLSSAWEAEKRQHKDWSEEYDFWMTPEINKKINHFQKSVVEAELEQAIDEKRIEEIYWVGGEPLVWDFHWRMMTKMVNNGHAGKVFCRYNTNLSKIENKDLHLFKDLLPHFKGYLICASIDGVGKTGEWIRTGLKWEKFLDHFRQGQSGNGGKTSMVLDVTLTLPGLFSMKEMFDVATELDARVITKIIFAFDPEVVLSPLALPKQVLHPILDDLIQYTEKRATENTKSLVETFYELKKRPTFAEQFPESYKQAFITGRDKQRKLASRRGDGSNEVVTLEEIYSQNANVLNWWAQDL